MSEWVASFEESTKEVVCDEPRGFLAVAWAVYRQAILNPAYYFSPSELLLFAHLGDTNLVTTQYSNGAFAVVGATPGAARGDFVFVSLECSGEDTERGHFERIWPREEMDEHQEAFTLLHQHEEEQRRRAELRRRELAATSSRAESQRRKVR